MSNFAQSYIDPLKYLNKPYYIFNEKTKKYAWVEITSTPIERLYNKPESYFYELFMGRFMYSNKPCVVTFERSNGTLERRIYVDEDMKELINIAKIGSL